MLAMLSRALIGIVLTSSLALPAAGQEIRRLDYVTGYDTRANVYTAVTGDFDGDGRLDEATLERDFDNLYLIAYLSRDGWRKSYVLEDMLISDLETSDVDLAGPGLYLADCSVGYFDDPDDAACFYRGVSLRTDAIALAMTRRSSYLYYWHEGRFLKMPLYD